ncbi:DUF3325 domain-containing protein [Sphingomonas colocasiae]|uniref:DUF3325 domain-containing protein n=1 Tax=Sphingomonas colocasiae TaxID=1848973 RepID=A0ABS7PRR5_9SPHN|nr:DUF3325 domain-containing protein [Sphingomonas colocasiae]MBY8824032.1 DUF3325 domain-containing protein [Sphingomonas colocasiae]
MIGILSAATAWLGFACLCLAMDRHQRDILGRRLSDSASRRLRLTGFAAIALGLATAIAALGWGYGAVLWFGLLTLGAAPIIALLSAWSSRAKR